MDEIWKPIPGYQFYEASSRGRIRSVTHLAWTTGGRSNKPRQITRWGKVLSPCPHNGGYELVTIVSGGKRLKRTVHSLVASAFIGPRPEGQDVMHLDGDRKNNSAENLSYGTRSENCKQTYSYGGNPGSTKLSLRDVDDIRGRLKAGDPRGRIAEDFSVVRTTVDKIANGRTFSWYRGGES